MKRSWIVVILIVCLVLTCVGIAVYWRNASEPVIRCEWPNTEQEAGSRQVLSMDNTDLAFFYWSEFFYFKEVNGNYLKDTVDFFKPLREQSYDGSMTWEDLVLQDALATLQDTVVMVLEAREQGFTMPDSYETAYQQSQLKFRDAAQRAGFDSLTDYIKASYGSHATEERFFHYLYGTYLASAYADYLLESIEVSDQEVQDYFDLHLADYTTVMGFDPDTPEQWMEAVREDLRMEQYQNEFRGIQSKYTFSFSSDGFVLTPPKGLYSK